MIATISEPLAPAPEGEPPADTTDPLRRRRIGFGIAAVVLGLIALFAFGFGIESGLDFTFVFSRAADAVQIPDLTLPARTTCIVLACIITLLGVLQIVGVLRTRIYPVFGIALALFAHVAAPQIRLTKDPNTYFFFLDHLDQAPPFRIDDATTWDTNLELGVYWGIRLVERAFYAGGGGSVRGFGFQLAGDLDDDHNPLGGRSLLEEAGLADDAVEVLVFHLRPEHLVRGLGRLGLLEPRGVAGQDLRLERARVLAEALVVARGGDPVSYLRRRAARRARRGRARGRSLVWLS